MNVKKIIAINFATVVILGGVGFGGFYFYDQTTNYIKTDYAKVTGEKTAIVSPSAGVLTSWDVKTGEQLKKGDVLGTVTVPMPSAENPNGKKEIEIVSPTDGKVVSASGVENSLVGQGSPLAYSYNFNDLYVTSNIKETLIDEVEVGQEVDVYIDSFKNVEFKGEVSEIGLTTSSEFSLLPQGNANANYTKVTQVVPVKIKIKDTKGYDILPGMNVTVRIHK